MRESANKSPKSSNSPNQKLHRHKDIRMSDKQKNKMLAEGKNQIKELLNMKMKRKIQGRKMSIMVSNDIISKANDLVIVSHGIKVNKKALRGRSKSFAVPENI